MEVARRGLNRRMPQKLPERLHRFPRMGCVCVAQHVRCDETLKADLGRSSLHASLDIVLKDVEPHPLSASRIIAMVLRREHPEPLPMKGIAGILCCQGI